MNLRYFYLLFLCWFAIDAKAELVWQQQYPQPTQATLRHVETMDGITAWACGAWGTICRTTNGGAHWQTVITDSLPGAYYPSWTSSYMLDSQQFWFGGAGGYVLHTTDGGTSWVMGETGYYGFVADLWFVNPDTGWAVERGVIFNSTDGGFSWSVNDSSDGMALYYAVYFRDALHGWIAGCDYHYGENGEFQPDPAILYTEDGGVSWTRQTVNFTDLGFVEDLTFVDSQIGFAVGATVGPTGHQTDLILHTEDGGTNWNVQRSPMPHPIHELDFINADTGFAATWEDIIWTSDGGATWEERSSYQANQTSIGLSILPNGMGWGVGMTGRIYRTTDFFATLQLQSDTALSNLHSVSAIDPEHAWAVGDNGLALETTDGNRWQVRNLQTAAALHDVTFLNSQEGWIGADSGRIYHTINSGETWELQPTGTSTHAVNAIQMVTNNVGWAVCGSQTGEGVEPLLLHTTNGGVLWEDWRMTQATHPLMEVQFVSESIGWIVSAVWLTTGFAGEVFKTTDGGDSWTLQYSADQYLLHSLCFPDSLNGYMLVQYSPMGGGGILQTTDGGATWTASVYGDIEIYTMYFSSRTDGWISSFLDGFWHTSDGGQSWGGVRLPVGTTGLFAFDALSSTCLWAVGVNAHILQACDDSSASVEPPVGNLLPRTIGLSAFPNPFNSIVNLKIEIPAAGRVSLEIYNIMGQRISTLVDQPLLGGSYTFRWNADGAASGVYFSRLTMNGQMVTNKILLMK